LEGSDKRYFFAAAFNGKLITGIDNTRSWKGKKRY